MRQCAGPFNMAKKLGAQSGARMRSLDEPGNVGHYIAVFMGELTDGDHTQVRLKRCKRIIGNLGPGR